MNMRIRGAVAFAAALTLGISLGGIPAYADESDDAAQPRNQFSQQARDNLAKLKKQVKITDNDSKFTDETEKAEDNSAATAEYMAEEAKQSGAKDPRNTDPNLMYIRYDAGAAKITEIKPSAEQATAVMVGEDYREAGAKVELKIGKWDDDRHGVYPTMSKVTDPVSGQTLLAYGADSGFPISVPDKGSFVFNRTPVSKLPSNIKMSQGVLWILKNTYPHKSIEEMKAAGLPTGSEQETVAGVQSALWKLFNPATEYSSMGPKVKALYSALLSKAQSMSGSVSDADVASGVGQFYLHNRYLTKSPHQAMPLVGAKVLTAKAETTGETPKPEVPVKADKPKVPQVEQPAGETVDEVNGDDSPELRPQPQGETKVVTPQAGKPKDKLTEIASQPSTAKRALADTGQSS